MKMTNSAPDILCSRHPVGRTCLLILAPLLRTPQQCSATNRCLLEEQVRRCSSENEMQKIAKALLF